MKELYFKPESIADVSYSMFESVRNYSRERQPVFKPPNSALLVLDMQNIFLKHDSHAFIPSAPAIIPNIQMLLAEYFRLRLPVIFTRHTNDNQNAGMMSGWWKELIGNDTVDSEIISELDTDDGLIITKNQYDAFYNTNLDEVLKEQRVTQLVICGVMTHLCCETTARSAFMRGYQLLFPVDGTATYNKMFHQASLLNLAHGFVNLVLVENLLKVLNG